MDTSFDKARFNMIQQQIRPWDVIDDRVLEVMSEIQREHFVPDAYRGLAYADIEIPFGNGQSMLAPKVVGRLLQALAVKTKDRVLEIGTGSGYVTACLARLGGQVVSIEIDSTLAELAQGNLGAGKLHHLEVRQGDGLVAPIDGGPFDVIAVTGSMPDGAMLPGLQEQLAVGGRLFAIIGKDPAMQATLVTRTVANGFEHRGLFETSVLALANIPEPERFVF